MRNFPVFFPLIGLSLVTILSGCGGGSSSSAAPSSPRDTTSPVVRFTPATLTVASGATGSSTLSATDNIGITNGPTVSCTNGGAFSNNTFTAPTVTVQTTSVCTATASDAAGNSGSGTLTVTIEPPSQGDVTISGKATYDFIPHNTVTNGLDYASISQQPIKGATVQLLNGTDSVIDTTVTDNNGDYSFTVDANTDVRVRVRAELLSTSGAIWDIKVTDNTNGHAVYAMQGSLVSSGSANSTRNLNASSGWGGSSYTGSRTAAPFAILDSAYATVTAFASIDNDVNFPAMEFRWSTRNEAVSGTLTNGEIGTSSYRRASGSSQGNVYILGDEDSDTDEYDRHIIVHEWGHYFEDRMSRSDSIGGQHSLGNRLDPRVAMGEGWGNALSGIILGDSVYRDSGGNQQSSGFSFDVESNTNSNAGWYNEGSVQSILYDLFDSDDDGSDTISLGLGPIYEAFVASDYTEQVLFTTIFGFISELKSQQPTSATAIDSLINAQSISGTDASGTGETNAGGVTNSLPVYSSISVNGGAVQVCSFDDNGSYNKLGNRQFLTVNIPSSGSYTFTMTKTSGPDNRDPDFNIFRADNFVGQGNSSVTDSETLVVTLQAGDHVIDAFEYNNIDPGTAGDSCFDFSVTG